MAQTSAQLLDQAILNVDNLIANLTANPNGKPTYSLDGVSYSWESYLAMLIDKRLALEQARQRADNGGAWESLSYGA